MIGPLENQEDVARRVWDVIVIGAGPAGALVARLAAREGAATLLIERKRFPRAKVCGGCLNASAVVLLQTLGLGAIISESGLPVDHLWVGMQNRRARLPLPGGVAIPRTSLDSELAVQARAAGVTFLSETRAVLGKDMGTAREVRITNAEQEQTVSGRAVVIATGLGNSALGKGLEFVTRVAPGSRLGAGCVIQHDDSQAYPKGRISMAVGRFGYVGVTRTIEGLVVASALDSDFLKRQATPAHAAETILREARFPHIPELLSADWSGTLPLTRTTRPVGSSRVFLIGDAAGYVEPFTGQGMAIALQGAVALTPFLVQAISNWTPAIATAWKQQYSRRVESHHWPALLIASIVRRPSVAGFAFALADVAPALPGALVRAVNRPAVHPSSI